MKNKNAESRGKTKLSHYSQHSPEEPMDEDSFWNAYQKNIEELEAEFVAIEEAAYESEITSHIEGEYRRATLEDPPEYPELIIEGYEAYRGACVEMFLEECEKRFGPVSDDVKSVIHTGIEELMGFYLKSEDEIYEAEAEYMLEERRYA